MKRLAFAVLLWTSAAFGQAVGGGGVPGAGSGGGPPSGAAGGALTGTYPNPGLNVSAVQGVISTFYSQAGDTIASIESECSSACSYIVTIPQTFTLGANHTLSNNVNLSLTVLAKKE